MSYTRTTPLDAQPQAFETSVRMPTTVIVTARLVAAILNVAPPLVGSYALGRETYGLVASVLAMAIIAFGPISQYLSQSLLRTLCTGQRGDRAAGAAIVYCLGCIAVAIAVLLAGLLPLADALQLATLVVALTLLRTCEVDLISADRIVPSIVVFYAMPPVLCSALYLVAGALGGGHAAAAAAQSTGYAIAAVFAMGMAPGVRRMLMQAIANPLAPAALELGRSYPLLLSGLASSGAELLPVVLLRGLNAYAVIPLYEIARKIASVPTTFANPLLNQVNPAVIRAYASQDRGEIQRLIRDIFRLLTWAGGVFAVFVGATLVAGFYEPRVQDVAELLLPLALGTVVAMCCVPYQSLLIAAHGDRWFTVSSSVSVALLLAITRLCAPLGPGLAVSWAVGISVAASSLIIRWRASKVA